MGILSVVAAGGAITSKFDGVAIGHFDNEDDALVGGRRYSSSVYGSPECEYSKK